jgi:ABC-2 type transport system permease protein
MKYPLFTARTLRILRWEYTQRVRSRAFLFSLILLPLVIALFTVLPTWLARGGSDDEFRLAIADRTGWVAARMEEKLSTDSPYKFQWLEVEEPDSARAAAEGRSLIELGAADGYLYLGADLPSSRTAVLHRSFQRSAVTAALESALRDVLMEEQLSRVDSHAEALRRAVRPLRMTEVAVRGSDEELLQRYTLAITVVLILSFSIINSGGGFLRGLLEERGTKVLEMILSSVSAGELMAGKIAGLGLVGLTQLAVWTAAALVFGGTTFLVLAEPATLLLFLLYFVLGYLMFAALFAAAGAALGSEQDVQYVQSVLSLLGVLPTAFAFLVLSDPHSLLVQVLSYIPPLTPTFMMLRVAVSQPPWYHVLGTSVTLFVFLAACLRVAGRTFETSLLLQGQRWSPSSLWRRYRRRAATG